MEMVELITELTGIDFLFYDNYVWFMANHPEIDISQLELKEKHNSLAIASNEDESIKLKIVKDRYVQISTLTTENGLETSKVTTYYNSIKTDDVDYYEFNENYVEKHKSYTLNGVGIDKEALEALEKERESITRRKFVVSEITIRKEPYIFKSKIKLLDDAIDANQLFQDIEKSIQELKDELGVEHLGRRHPLQTILNRTSGNYIAPTSMKSFDQSPGDYLYDMLTREEKGTATYNGTSWHNIMDKFYTLPQEERTEEKLWALTEEQIVLDEHDEENAELIRFFTKGYIEAPDYLVPEKRAIDLASEIEVSPEYFAKPAYDKESGVDASIKPLGVTLNIPGGTESTPEQYSIPVYNLIDRVDIRDGQLYIIDYKTGAPGDPTEYTMGINGYLPQMIYYKWSIEALYGQEVAGVYIMVPGAESQEMKFAKMNVNSLVNQSKVVEKSIEHLKSVNEIKKTKIFPIKKMIYRSKLAQWYDLSNYNQTTKLLDAPDEVEITLKVRREVYK